MTVKPAIQLEFERNLTWKRSWPRCFLALIATVEILLGLVILVTEIFNILMDFWHTNVFGGIWASIILLINWILIFVTVCCTTIRASTCSLVFNFITVIAFALLIVFDVIFLVNPYTCILTPTCSNQSQLVSFNYIVQTIPQFQNYSSYDSKKLFLEIQVGCAGVAFLLSIMYIVIFVLCRLKLRKRATLDNGGIVILPPQRGLRIAQAPPMQWGAPPNDVPHAPY